MLPIRMTAAVLPPAGPLRRYALISLIDATGTGLFMAASMMFFTRVAGLRPGAVALGLSVAGLAALAAAVPLGSLGDRCGHRRMWVLLALLEAVAFAAYPLVHSFPAFAVVAALAAVAEAGTSPVRAARLSRLAGPAQRVRAKAYNQSACNAGFAAGALCAAAAMAAGTRTACETLVLANAASYVIVAVLVVTLPAGTPPAGTLPAGTLPAGTLPAGTLPAGTAHAGTAPAATPAARACAAPARRAAPGSRGVLHDVRYLTVSVLNGLLMIYGSVLTVALPLWILHRTQAPSWAVAGTFGLNTLLAVSLQVRASRGADTVPGAARAIRRAGCLLLLACAAFAFSGVPGGPGALVAITVGCILLTAGEMLHSAGAWGLSYGLAPAERHSEYLGAFAMGSRIYDTAGPVVASGLILGLGTLGWLLLGLLFAILGAVLSPAAHWAGRGTRDTRAAAVAP